MTLQQRNHEDLRNVRNLCVIGLRDEASAEMFAIFRRNGYSTTDIYMLGRDLEKLSMQAAHGK